MAAVSGTPAKVSRTIHRSELAYKEREGKLFQPGCLAWAAETWH